MGQENENGMNGVLLREGREDEIEVPSPLEFQGVLEFDLGPVYHPSFGSVNVKSSFPRFKPRNERGLVSKEEIESLQKKLLEWVNVHFNTTGKEQYFTELAFVSTVGVVHAIPVLALISAEMDLATKFMFWLWINDDELESAIEKKVPLELLQMGTRMLSNVLAGEYDSGIKTYPDIEEHDFKPLFNSLLDLHKRCGVLVPDYANRVGPFRHTLQRHYAAHRWGAIDCIDGRYSEETFRIWRGINAFTEGCVEMVSLILGVTISPEIAQSPICVRLIEISNSVGGLVNDLLGMKKEFKDGKNDSLVAFKVLCKGIPLGTAVDEICTLIKAEMTDYLLLKRVILREFGNDENLVKYLDILESLLYGHEAVYHSSKRYQITGCIKIIL